MSVVSSSPTPDALPEAEVTRPCVYCGRPVEQTGAAGRPFRYCRDNDNACQRNARNGRMRERNSPGLSGQVARSWELVERLELLTGTLADALHAELSPAGVERQTATVRAEAATHVAGAHTERDEARREAEAARAEVARLTDVVTKTSALADSHGRQLDQAREEILGLKSALAQAQQERDVARSAATADAALRAEAVSARDQAVAAAEGHRVAAEGHRAETEHAVRQVKAALADAEKARAAAATAVTNARESLAAHERSLAELDALRAEVTGVRAQVVDARAETATVSVALSEARSSLEAAEAATGREREAHRRTLWERDAARSETTAAQATVVELRAEQLRLATEAAEVRGALQAAQSQTATVTAALAARPTP